jgi:hypothetical protein
LICPAQQASGVWIDYKRNIGVGGFRQVGTIHSHPDFSAYHSAIDEDDENGFDGVHITLGNVDEPCFSCSVELAINGARFKLSPESIIEGIRQIENAGIEPPETSLETVSSAEKVKPAKVEKQKRYQLFNEAVQFIESAVYPKEWLDNVGGIIGKDKFDDFEEEVKNGDQSHRLRRHRLLSFTLFGKVFTLSVQRQR